MITDRPLYPGEMAAAGTPLLTVMDISSVIAKAHIPQSEAATLKPGDAGTMTVPGFDKPIEGKVTVVSPALDPNSTTVEIWFEARNPKRDLKPGTSVQLALTAQTVNGALVDSAEFRAHRARWRDHGHAGRFGWPRSSEAVKLGIRNGEDVQVLEGLSESDKVVSNGAYGLPDKTKIKIEAPEAPAEGENAKPAAGDVKNSHRGIR